MAKLRYYVKATGENTSPDATGSRIITVSVIGNYSGTTEFKLDSGSWQASTLIFGFPGFSWTNVSTGWHDVHFRDSNGERKLISVYITPDGEGCRTPYNGGSGTYQYVADLILQLDGAYLNIQSDDLGRPYGYKTTSGGSFTYGSGTNSTAILSGSALNQVNNIIPGLYRTKQSNGCVEELARDIYNKDVEVEPLAVAYTKTDVTYNGGADGTITLTVTGGSGDATFEWSDGPTTQNRTGLSAGTYEVTITDLGGGSTLYRTIEILQPAPPVIPASLLDVPAMNSLTFVIEQDIDNCDNPQGLDNVLLKDQYYPDFLETDYLQKVCKCDNILIQFNSDFESFSISLHKYCNDEVVKAFPFELKEQNLNVTETYSIVIRNHSGFPGQSRVYFNSGAPPIPLQVDQTFTILNNADGFNGTYAIVDILNDSVLGYQYIVINKNYSIPDPNSNATGEFYTSTVDYNVFETQLDLTDVTDGEYYARIVASEVDVESGEVTTIAARSEPIDLKVEHEGTCHIIYRNFDNAFNITWTTGYIGQIRVESLFGHKRSPGGERTISRNSDYSAVKVSAKKTRTLTFETFMLPPYLHEKLSVIFDMDFKSINRVQVEATEGYSEPDYINRFLLANSSIKVEQVGWFDNYTSDDIGSVTNTNFLSIEDGLLKI